MKDARSVGRARSRVPVIWVTRTVAVTGAHSAAEKAAAIPRIAKVPSEPAGIKLKAPTASPNIPPMATPTQRIGTIRPAGIPDP